MRPGGIRGRSSRGSASRVPALSRDSCRPHAAGSRVCSASFRKRSMLRSARDTIAAMTSRSRGMFSPELFQIHCPSSNRGSRECRLRAAPAVSCAKNCAFGAHEHTGERKHSDIPCATALRLISCSPRWSGLVVNVIGGTLPANLAPASRRQDHTTSPYALVHSSIEQRRPSQPQPSFRDDREAPLVWAGMRKIKSVICPTWKAEYFSFRGLTRFLKIRSDLPVVSNLSQLTLR